MNKKYSIPACLLLVAGPALAHHPLAGAPMQTFFHGILSGIGHPVLGFDHLFFVIAVGIAACFTGWRLLAPAFYLVGMTTGVALIIAGIALPLNEMMIALTLVALGGCVLAGKALPLSLAAPAFLFAGIFHGWAFGQSIAGYEALAISVLTGYLIGLTTVQWLIAATAGAVVVHIWKAARASDIRPRLAGAVVAGVGAAFLLEHLESHIFSMLA